MIVDRATVAANYNTPVEALIELSEDAHQIVRWWVTRNPNTPLEVLIKLSNDEDEYVRYYSKQARINRIGLLK